MTLLGLVTSQKWHGPKILSLVKIFLYIKSDWGAFFGSVGLPWSSLQKTFLLGVLSGLKAKPETNHPYLFSQARSPASSHEVSTRALSMGSDTWRRRDTVGADQEGEESLGGMGEYSILVEN